MSYQEATGLQSKGIISTLTGWLKSHPIIFLLLMSPGIPEYLSSNTSLTTIFFFLPLALNVGLYTTGVLLIREAMIRWRKGWASVFLLGAAYGIVEEGLDVWTLFYSNADPVGTLGYYGHWLGINWVWSMGILIFHSIFSIGLPIFLFGLAFPEMKTKLLLSFHGIRNAFLILIADSLVLFVGDFSHYQGYNPGAGVLLFACIVTGLLIVTARKLPGDFLKISQGPPKWGPKRYALVGALFFPIEFLAGYVAAGANLPPLIPMVFDLALTLFVFTVVYKSMGSTLNEKQKTAFGVGLLLPIVAFGLIAGLGRWNFLIVVADLFVVLFARRLWRKWSNWTLLQQEHLTTTLPGLGGPSTSPFSS